MPVSSTAQSGERLVYSENTYYINTTLFLQLKTFIKVHMVEETGVLSSASYCSVNETNAKTTKKTGFGDLEKRRPYAVENLRLAAKGTGRITTEIVLSLKPVQT